MQNFSSFAFFLTLSFASLNNKMPDLCDIISSNRSLSSTVCLDMYQDCIIYLASMYLEKKSCKEVCSIKDKPHYTCQEAYYFRMDPCHFEERTSCDTRAAAVVCHCHAEYGDCEANLPKNMRIGKSVFFSARKFTFQEAIHEKFRCAKGYLKTTAKYFCDAKNTVRIVGGYSRKEIKVGLNNLINSETMFCIELKDCTINKGNKFTLAEISTRSYTPGEEIEFRCINGSVRLKTHYFCHGNGKLFSYDSKGNKEMILISEIESEKYLCKKKGNCTYTNKVNRGTFLPVREIEFGQRFEDMYVCRKNYTRTGVNIRCLGDNNVRVLDRGFTFNTTLFYIRKDPDFLKGLEQLRLKLIPLEAKRFYDEDCDCEDLVEEKKNFKLERWI